MNFDYSLVTRLRSDPRAAVCSCCRSCDQRHTNAGRVGPVGELLKEPKLAFADRTFMSSFQSTLDSPVDPD